ncbi:MAG: hypothetical protein R3E82_00115 [Pseudomonadales bacterium]
MRDFALPPYFHPTTVCVVDDNEPFLTSLDLELPPGMASRVFTDPHKALTFLQTPIDLPALMDRCFSMQLQSGSRALIELDLSLIEQEINFPDRFRRNSVLLVDYSMPRMDGLELCAALDDALIRRALLTGVADEKLAVQAFNAGLIHRYIPKHLINPLSVIVGFIEELQREYFSQYTARLKSVLSINPPRFLIDPVIARYVRNLMRRERLIEYYLVSDPPGLLLLNSSGRLWRLALLNREQVREQVVFARSRGAPADVIAQLDSGNFLGFFCGTDPDDDFSADAYPWQELVFPAVTLVGATGSWQIALWRDAVSDIDFDPAGASYDTYTRSL